MPEKRRVMVDRIVFYTLAGVVVGGGIGNTFGPVGCCVGAVVGGVLGLAVSASEARSGSSPTGVVTPGTGAAGVRTGVVVPGTVIVQKIE